MLICGDLNVTPSVSFQIDARVRTLADEEFGILRGDGVGPAGGTRQKVTVCTVTAAPVGAEALYPHTFSISQLPIPYHTAYCQYLLNSR